MSCKRYMMSVSILMASLIGMTNGGWLDSSGPDYGELRSYFSDPIFYSGGPNSKVDYSQYYPYFGSGFFQDPGSSRKPAKNTLVLGKVARQRAEAKKTASGYVGMQFDPSNSEFRTRVLSPSEIQARRESWAKALEFAQKNSSLRIYTGGDWTVVQDVDKLS